MFRRGKLNFLSTKDDRIKIINDRINLTEKHLIEMCSNFSACTRRLAKYRDSYDELAKCFKNYADDEEINESLAEGLKSFTNASTILGDYMDIQVHRMEMKIVNELAMFETLCKTSRDNLRTAVIARDKEVLKQRQMLEIKSKFAANNTAADSELLKAKLEVNRTNKEIDEIISNFEKRKLSDIKTILHDFILISMKYHTKALEALSASYYDVSNINEKSDFLEFQKLMKSKEEPQARKQALKKGLRSQSMESLDRDHLLSPMKRRNRLSKSTKNLAGKSDDELDDDQDDDDDDDEEEDDDAEGDSEENSNAEEEDSGSASDDDEEEVASDSASEAKPSKTDLKSLKSKFQVKQQLAPPTKTTTSSLASHVFKSKPGQSQTAAAPFAAKTSSVGIPSSSSAGLAVLTKRNSVQFEDDKGAIAGTGAGRLVTFVESKKTKRRSVDNNAANEVIDCSRGIRK